MKKLLFLGAMLLIGGSANAAFDANGERMKPVPTKAAFNYGDTLYMYNVGAKMFWGGGNDWNTRASVLDAGVQVTITQKVDDGAEWDGKTVQLRNWVVQHNRWDNVFCSGAEGTIWVDNSTDPNNIWNIVAQGDEVYRFQMSDQNPNFPGDGTTFIGHDANIDNGTNTRVWAFLKDSVGYNIDWYFVNATDYKAYQDVLLPAFDASKELLSIMNQAKEKGVDVTAAQAVYANEAATVEEIEAAILAVKKVIAALDEGSASAENPLDKTSLLVNPMLDVNADGWSGDKPTIGGGAAEHFNKTFRTYQDVEGAPNGVYMLTVQSFYRCDAWGTAGAYDHLLAGTAKNVAAYAKSGEDSLFVAVNNIFEGATNEKLGVDGEAEISVSDGQKLWVPRNMTSAGAYFAAGRYVNKMFFTVENNKTRIGLAKNTKIGDDWTMFGNWTLTYYGNGEDAYKLWMQEVIAAAPNYDNLPEGTLVTNGVIDTYKAVVESVSGAATKADILAGKAAIDTAAAVVDANIAAWKTLAEAKARAEKTAANSDLADTDEKMELADYVEFELADIIAALELSTEEVLALAKEVDDKRIYVERNALKVDGDVTEMFLTNADYSQGTTGWKGTWGAVSQGCMEAYAIDWDAYQIVEDAPQGVYEVSLQGFYRVKRGTDAWTMWQNGQQTCPGHVYVNNNETEVPCVFTEPVKSTENFYTGETSGAEGDWCQFETETPGDSVCFPNTMKSAGEAFTQGMYQASAFGLVAKKGDVLRLGVKGKKQDATWVIWDNFKMVYRGFRADIIKPHLELAKTNAEANTAKTMGKGTKEILNAAIAAGTAALAQEDGKVMFEALSALYAANDTVNTSVALFEELVAAAAALSEATTLSQASQDVKLEAEELYALVMGGVDEGTLNDDDVPALLDKITEMTAKVKIPAGASEATDANPVDLTSVIVNPGFESEGANSIAGWQNTDGYSFGNDDTQKAALMVEFYEKKFDIYQDILGLPNGTYEVGVQAFCSFGNTTTDYANFTENPTYNEAWLYAIPDADSTQMSTAYLIHRTAEAGAEKAYSGEGSFTNAAGETVYVPNSVVSSNGYFMEGYYMNKVIVKVANGKLRIGVAKPEQISGDWVIMDNWTLKYFGANSAQTPTGDVVTSIETVGGTTTPATVEFYNINGAKTTGVQKGINIVKTTMTDGTIIVKKIVVR